MCVCVCVCVCVCTCTYVLVHIVCYPCRPDGLKKAYVRLAPDYDALDVANKVSQWQDVL